MTARGRGVESLAYGHTAEKEAVLGFKFRLG